MTHLIRAAEPSELLLLEEIENRADALFLERLHPQTWRPAPAAEVRLARPGYVLVAAQEPHAAVIGFVHVLLPDHSAHLEQLSVLPSYGRRGHGRALVEAAKRQAALLGCGVITLRTFADIPWNAPFYSACGFVETEPGTPFQLELLEAELENDGARYGRRIQMTCELLSQ